MSKPVRLQLELDPGSEPIRGAVTGPDGQQHAYMGWLALIELLEEWRRCARLEEEQWSVSPPS